MFKSKLMTKIAQGEAGDYEFSCVMIPLPEGIADKFRQLGNTVIKDDELFEDPKDPSYGRPQTPHVTALYGIRESDCAHRVEQCLLDTLPAEFEITGFGKFDKDPRYEVIIARAGGRDLFSLNEALAKEFPDYENTHGEYKPHVTLGFVKKGLGDSVLDRLKRLSPRMRVPVEEVELSRADGKTEYIDMDHIRSRARIEVQDED